MRSKVSVELTEADMAHIDRETLAHMTEDIDNALNDILIKHVISANAKGEHPVMRARLANAYARAGGNDEKAARILGVTLGSARLARRRHLGATATDHRSQFSA